MAETFDLYHRWLGIPPEEQPAHHYRFLGLALFEEDPEVIRDAVEQRMAHVRTYQLGPHAGPSQQILNELAAAKATLLDPQAKAAYDQSLRDKFPASEVRFFATHWRAIAIIAVAMCLQIGLILVVWGTRPSVGDTSPTTPPQEPLVAGPAVVEPMPDENDADAIVDTRSHWRNHTYDQTISHVHDKQWIQVDNKTQRVSGHFTESARTDKYVELSGFNFGIGRLFPKRLEMKKGDRWEWASNGEWVTPEN